jgi:hypothetical protein
MRMLGRIVGLPEEDLEWLVEKGDALIANTDSDFTAHVLDQTNTDAFRLMPFRSPAGAELYDYAQGLMERKRATGDTSRRAAPDHPARRPGPGDQPTPSSATSSACWWRRATTPPAIPSPQHCRRWPPARPDGATADPRRPSGSRCPMNSSAGRRRPCTSAAPPRKTP